VSHAGVALIRVAQVAPDNRGRVVLCHPRLGVHGHHRVVVDVHHACAHLMATLVARSDDEIRRHMSFVDYTDADGNAHPVQNLDY
jgi:hypothetical protein